MNNVDITWIHNFINIKYSQSEDVKYQDHYNFYLLRAIPILDEYKKIKNQQNKLYFMEENIVSNSDSQKSIDKIQQLIKEYILIIQNYFYDDYIKNEWDNIKTSSISSDESSNNENIVKNMIRKKCSICQNDYDNFHIYENHLVCDCGFVYNTTHSTTSYKDIDRINISSKYTYDRRIHFRDCINQFQGKQNAKIDPSIYIKIKEQLFLHGILPDNYDELPKETAFKNVTKEHIAIFLKEIKQTKHNDDIILIYHQLTGKPTPDISHLETQLLNDFDLLVDTYDQKYKNSERKNFISTQYVLFQLLRRHKYPCKKEDFNMLKTIDRKYFHDNICSELFNDIGWTFTALF